MSLKLRAAFEAVSFQHDPTFFKQVTIAVSRIRRENDFSPTGDPASLIIDLIKYHTGLTVNFMYLTSARPSATAIVPEVNRSHVLLGERYRKISNSKDAIKLFRDKQTDRLEGHIDFDKHKVSGVFEEFPFVIQLSTGLFTSGSFSNEEIAAQLLHEVGHCFYYCALLAHSVTANITIEAVADEMVKAPREERIELLNATSRHFDFDAKEQEWLVDGQKKETIQSVLITRHIQQTRSKLGSNLYDARGFEALADQFAARMGAGVPLAKSLAKMDKFTKERYVGRWLVTEAIKVVVAGVALSMSPLMAVLLFLAYDPTDRIYDEPEQRFRRMRLELVAASKSKDITDEQKDALIQDLKLMDKVLDEFKDRRTFYEFLYTAFLPSIRDQRKRMLHQQKLEQLANNELFAQSMRLERL